MAFIPKLLILICLTGLSAKQGEQAYAAKGTWDSQLPGGWYTDGYKAVNNYLVTTVGVSEPMSVNMDAVFERLKSDDVADRERVVLNKLSGLKITEGKCDQISYEALDDNDKATGYKSHDITSKRSAPRRIDKLINHYGTQHAITCQKKTESLFKPIAKSIDRQILTNLAAWIDPIIERVLANFSPPKGLQVGDDFSSKVFHAIIMKAGPDDAVADPELAYNAIKTLVKDNPSEEKFLHYYSNERTGERVFKPTKIAPDLFQKYISIPCFGYRTHMRKLFDRAEIDAKFHHDVNPNEPMFYRGWAYSKICLDAFHHGFVSYDDLQKYAKRVADQEEEDEV